jgi:hypothetical protein
MDKQGLKDSYIPVDRNIEPLAVSHIVKGEKHQEDMIIFIVKKRT